MSKLPPNLPCLYFHEFCVWQNKFFVCFFGLYVTSTQIWLYHSEYRYCLAYLQTPFQNSILFSSVHHFRVYRTHWLLFGCHTLLVTALVSHWRFLDDHCMNISAEVLNFKIYNNHVEFCLGRCRGAWTVSCTFQCRPWTGSIKPGLQNLRFYCFALSLGVPYFCILPKTLYFFRITTQDTFRLFMFKLDGV